MEMKILFLDIDGVLCTEECSKKPYHPVFFYPFHIDCVNIFNHILLETNAEIVITSDWRKHLEFDLNRIDQLFKFNGVNKSPIDYTPDFGSNRNKEITSYIYKHKIKKFVIIDDMPLKVNSLRFVRTNLNDALIEDGVSEKIISNLNMDQSKICTCLNCDLEFHATTDNYACSVKCRNELEIMKSKHLPIASDEEIYEFIMHNKVSYYYLNH